MRRRLSLLEEVADPLSIRHLEARGVGPGWRCLEVGGGGGSIAAWLARAVGPTGHVLATDIDTRFLDDLAAPNLVVRRHDIAADDLPDGAFDLVHARAVLHHLPDHDRALARMTAALRPGGWLVVEDPDWASFQPESGHGPGGGPDRQGMGGPRAVDAGAPGRPLLRASPGRAAAPPRPGGG